MSDPSTPVAAATGHGDDVAPAQPGRGLELVPLPPGAGVLGLGLVLAALAPLLGFLGGSMIGTKGPGTVNPMYLSLFGGFVVGGLGVLLAGYGGLRLYRHLQRGPGEPKK